MKTTEKIRVYEWNTATNSTQQAEVMAVEVRPAFKPVKRYTFYKQIKPTAAKQRRKERAKYF